MAPPLFRSRPSWYQAGLAQIASRFSTVLWTKPPANLFLLPSFICQDLSPDGIHLTAVSGLHYVLHLFDQAQAVLTLEPRSPEYKLVVVQEAVRHHDDRLSYLEGRHNNVQNGANLKFAADAEFQDWVLNRSEEDWMTIIGLKRLGQMTPREWQGAARRQVTNFLREVLNVNNVRMEFSVLYVGNPVRGRTTGNTVLNVRLNSTAASERIRELYSGFFRRANAIQLPQGFRGISVRNKVTLATRIRIRILQQIANTYLASNPGATVDVRGYQSRPVLVTTPPRGAPNSRQMTYNFVEACKSLSTAFSDDALARIFQIVGTHHLNELRALFIVLNDDDRDRCLELARNYQHVPVRRGPPAAPAASAAASGHFSGQVFGSGAGMEVQDLVAQIAASPPPPPPPPRSSSLAPGSRLRHREGSEVSTKDPKSSRGLKRARLVSESDSDRTEKTRRKKKAKRARRHSSSSSGSESSDVRDRRKSKRYRSRRASSSASSSPARSPPRAAKKKANYDRER